ncbi:asparagine synthase (glutamine-hydrolyzing) [Thermoflavifilum thermophilum]|uniref:asparagine synthase (glutamine-hydrolyzing) n=1 Tax=Thermoflavifilum thermophilum TaxID=1393122 RepID=A0A1I7MYG2_9BACT|nr:asparagine synthase (glutamine-hydrolyzing) [Thermoflavifilum thermophilum]SFV27375.1 asparagine synthase (glutamine-hydrolysing) [Thermoflavifilum thermophilum]
MCGITGFIDTGVSSRDDLMHAIRQMTGSIQHRGPDDEGIWVDETIPIALGHRRLSIIDLSPSGHQPMVSAHGRYVMVFNGEIYNYLDIKQQLEASGDAPAWKGHSDTEVLLAAFEHWGPEKAIQQCIGMFAIALWDVHHRRLHLIRDRMGEKPLYYGWSNQLFLFGSELKAFYAHPKWTGEINRDALCLYLRHNYIPAPYSIFQHIFKLIPGSILTVSLEAIKKYSAQIPDAELQPKPYWSIHDVVQEGINNHLHISAPEAIDQLHGLMKDAVGKQMIADVPLGAFLSGGIDSSTVVALMQAQSSRPVKTFSIGFYEKEFNEAHYAAAVAGHLRTDHTELYVTPKDAFDIIPRLPKIYDEPFADSSQIPTCLISALTRKHVTVSLSGDGGDELFGGYNRYVYANDVWNWIRKIPYPVRKSIVEAIQLWPPEKWEKSYQIFKKWLPSRYQVNNAGDKIFKLSRILSANSVQGVYKQFISHWKDPQEVVIDGAEPSARYAYHKPADLYDFISWMMYVDAFTYLPDDILVKVDRAAMHVSLETRVPMLDHRIVEYVWKLPFYLKCKQKESKWILRQILYQYVPPELVNRPKMGFGVPLQDWLRGPLREWAEDLLATKRLKDEGFFHVEKVRQKWEEHISGRRNWQYHLWDILMFQAWLASYSHLVTQNSTDPIPLG